MNRIGEFSRGDMRKVWLVLGALLRIKEPTAISIAAGIGLPRTTVIDILDKISSGQIPRMILSKEGSVYVIEEWGDLINKKEVLKYYRETIQNEQ